MLSPIRETLSCSGQLEKPLFHSHAHFSFPKANGTYHEMLHSTSSAANFLPDMKKCSPQCSSSLSPPSESPSSAFNHTQNRGRPQRNAADKILFIESAILFVQSILSKALLLHFISYSSYEVRQSKYIYLFLQRRKERSHLYKQTW